MLPSYLLASCLGAPPTYLSVYPHPHYLTRGSTQLCVRFPSDPRSLHMAASGAEGQGQLSTPSPAPQSSPTDLSHSGVVVCEDTYQTRDPDRWGEQDATLNSDHLTEKHDGLDEAGEEWPATADSHEDCGPADSRTEKETQCSSSSSSSSSPCPSSSSCSRLPSSAVKFSIDSILGLRTTPSHSCTRLGSQSETGRVSSGSLTAGDSYHPAFRADSTGLRGTEALMRGNSGSTSSNMTSMTSSPQQTLQGYNSSSATQSSDYRPSSTAVMETCQTALREDSSGTHHGQDDEDGEKNDDSKGGEDEAANYPWLQCTRYHPPKLQRSKKKDGGSKKRKLGRNPRVPFTQQQVAVLEEKFRRTHYLSSMDVAELSSALTLSETRVKIWFQNRRARERREREASQRARLLTQKPYQPLSIPSVTWALTSPLTPSPFIPRYRNDLNFRSGLFTPAFNAFCNPVRHDVGAESQSSLTCSLWPDNHNSDENIF